ncbi:unnamed protein product [Urochloa humidicola]
MNPEEKMHACLMSSIAASKKKEVRSSTNVQTRSRIRMEVPPVAPEIEGYESPDLDAPPPGMENVEANFSTGKTKGEGSSTNWMQISYNENEYMFYFDMMEVTINVSESDHECSPEGPRAKQAGETPS